jgi:hypothetical protein
LRGETDGSSLGDEGGSSSRTCILSASFSFISIFGSISIFRLRENQTPFNYYSTTDGYDQVCFFFLCFLFLVSFFFYIFFILNQSDLPNPESAWNFIIRLLSVSHFYLVSFPMLTSLSKFLFLFCFWKSFNEARFDDFHIKFLESNWAFNDIA